MGASATRLGIAGVGPKQSDVRARLEVGDVRADRDDDTGTLVTEDKGVWHSEHPLLEISVQDAAVGVADTSSENLDETFVGSGGGDWDHLAGDRGTASGTGDETEGDHLSISGLGSGRHDGYLAEGVGYKVSTDDRTGHRWTDGRTRDGMMENGRGEER